jgi:phosphoribosylglycinamide formyltransferase-1
MKKIAIFASGSGTNAQRIIEYFMDKQTARVEIILCNKPDAYVLERAKKMHIFSAVFTREEFYKTDKILTTLRDLKIDLVVLAGFLWLIPAEIIKAYPKRIINIHPALLPKYGGKGMFGENVHKAVIANHEKESGITIHYVNENYDEGNTIFQATCQVEPSDTADSLAAKIHTLEHMHFPLVIQQILDRLD